MTTIGRTFLATALVLLCAPAAYGQGAVPAGDEFQINSGTAGHQWSPSVASLAGGGFVALWTNDGPSGPDFASEIDIQGQRYAADGTPLGDQFLVNSQTAGDQQSPSAAALSDGGFVAVWKSHDPSDPSSSGWSIRGRRHAADGTAVGEEFQINSQTWGVHGAPAVVTLADGSFVVVWILDYTLRGQRYAADGTAQGGQFLVNPNTEGDPYSPSVAALAGGGFAVAWYNSHTSGDDVFETSIRGQRFAADGTTLGWDFQVNSSPVYESSPSIAALAGGGFVVAWDGSSSDDVHGQLYSPDGTVSGGEFRINASSAGLQRHPSATAAGGGFVVAWDSVTSIRGQRYAADGRALGGEFLIDSYTAVSQDHPSVAALNDGGFTVAWQRRDAGVSDPPRSSIQGRLYADPRFALVLEDLCLEVESEPAVDGTPVNLDACDGGETQRWRLDLTSLPQRVSGIGGKCLIPGSDPTSDNGRIVVGDCAGPKALWRLETPNHARPSALIHVESGQCLDVDGGNVLSPVPDGGMATILSECLGTTSQLWRPAAEICTRDSLGLCLNQERFRVDLEWRSFDDTIGSGKAVPVGSDDSGLLWFFEADNWEMLIKVLDGCTFNDHLWVFAAASTNVEYILRVTDTWVGTVREYHNDLGTAAAAITDTSAFAACPAPSAAADDSSFAETPALEPIRFAAEVLDSGIPSKGACVPSLTRMCLSDGRFSVEVTWRDYAGNLGSAQVVPVGSASPGPGANDTSGLFWFFDSGNWEMLVKVLDACDFNDQFLFLGAATTDVEYTVTVTDLDAGVSWQHTNPLGHASEALFHWFKTCS